MKKYLVLLLPFILLGCSFTPKEGEGKFMCGNDLITITRVCPYSLKLEFNGTTYRVRNYDSVYTSNLYESRKDNIVFWQKDGSTFFTKDGKAYPACQRVK